jgi:hypothetical protein
VTGITVYPSDGTGAADVAPVDPDAIVDYVIDWTAWLAGDNIATSAWELVNCTESSASNTTKTATVFISAAVAGKVVTMRNRITTSGGRTEDRTLRASVREK